MMKVLCAVCGHLCATYYGLQTHMRVKHYKEYKLEREALSNAENKILSKHGKNPSWTFQKLEHLASLDFKASCCLHDVKHLVKLIKETGQSLSSIITARESPNYRRAFEFYKFFSADKVDSASKNEITNNGVKQCNSMMEGDLTSDSVIALEDCANSLEIERVPLSEGEVHNLNDFTKSVNSSSNNFHDFSTTQEISNSQNYSPAKVEERNWNSKLIKANSVNENDVLNSKESTKEKGMNAIGKEVSYSNDTELPVCKGDIPNVSVVTKCTNSSSNNCHEFLTTQEIPNSQNVSPANVDNRLCSSKLADRNSNLLSENDVINYKESEKQKGVNATGKEVCNSNETEVPLPDGAIHNLNEITKSVNSSFINCHDFLTTQGITNSQNCSPTKVENKICNSKLDRNSANDNDILNSKELMKEKGRKAMGKELSNSNGTEFPVCKGDVHDFSVITKKVNSSSSNCHDFLTTQEISNSLNVSPAKVENKLCSSKLTDRNSNLRSEKVVINSKECGKEEGMNATGGTICNGNGIMEPKVLDTVNECPYEVQKIDSKEENKNIIENISANILNSFYKSVKNLENFCDKTHENLTVLSNNLMNSAMLDTFETNVSANKCIFLIMKSDNTVCQKCDSSGHNFNETVCVVKSKNKGTMTEKQSIAANNSVPLINTKDFKCDNNINADDLCCLTAKSCTKYTKEVKNSCKTGELKNSEQSPLIKSMKGQNSNRFVTKNKKEKEKHSKVTELRNPFLSRLIEWKRRYFHPTKIRGNERDFMSAVGELGGKRESCISVTVPSLKPNQFISKEKKERKVKSFEGENKRFCCDSVLASRNKPDSSAFHKPLLSAICEKDVKCKESKKSPIQKFNFSLLELKTKSFRKSKIVRNLTKNHRAKVTINGTSIYCIPRKMFIFRSKLRGVSKEIHGCKSIIPLKCRKNREYYHYMEWKVEDTTRMSASKSPITNDTYFLGKNSLLRERSVGKQFNKICVSRKENSKKNRELWQVKEIQEKILQKENTYENNMKKLISKGKTIRNRKSHVCLEFLKLPLQIYLRSWRRKSSNKSKNVKSVLGKNVIHRRS